ncbi:hypothetical protein ACF06W_18455 [Streptomyces albus]|uniref:hypothetical protein n=1 Tax=Streptomyces albus TaxID=1888 RepID=UPI0036F830E1
MNTSDDQQPNSAAEKLRQDMLALMDEYARMTAAERVLPDADPLEGVKRIAGTFGVVQTGGGDTLDDFLDRLADQHSLNDVYALRLAGEVAQAITPRVVRAAHGRGKKVPQIAKEIGITESRVYQILREQRGQ